MPVAPAPIAPTLAAPAGPTAAERIGALLLRERTAARLSQRVLAERVGVAQATLARWERGRSAPTLAQADRVLSWLGLRMRLDVEPTPDPGIVWDREALRLAALTPAQRLDESRLGLAPLMLAARKRGVTGWVDGQTAAWLQGVPGRPRRMEIAATSDQVAEWVRLERVVQGGVDGSLLPLYLPKDELAEQFVADGHGLLASIYGPIRLRVANEVPPTVKVELGPAGADDVLVVADVISLDALAGHWRQQTP